MSHVHCAACSAIGLGMAMEVGQMTNQPSNREASQPWQQPGARGAEGFVYLEVGRKQGRVSPPSASPNSPNFQENRSQQSPDAQLPQASPFTIGPCKASSPQQPNRKPNTPTGPWAASFPSSTSVFFGASHPPQSLVSTVASLLLPWSRAIGSLELAILDDCVFFFFFASRALVARALRDAIHRLFFSSLCAGKAECAAGSAAVLLDLRETASPLCVRAQNSPTRPRLQQPVRPRREASRLFTSPELRIPIPHPRAIAVPLSSLDELPPSTRARIRLSSPPTASCDPSHRLPASKRLSTD